MSHPEFLTHAVKKIDVMQRVTRCITSIFLTASHSHFQRPKGFLYVFSSLLSMLVFVVALSSWGSAALAAPGIPHSTGQQFSRQARIGFHVGDDWEPSITADRYSHVYEKPCFIVAYDTLIEGRH